MTISRQYFGLLDDEGFIVQCSAFDVDDEGPPPPFPFGEQWRLLPGPVDWGAQPTTTSKLFVVNGALHWVETAPLGELRARAIEAIDAAGEALRLAVINQMTTQTEEYRRVEAQARAWREAGYPEDEENTAPRGVRGWAMAKHREGWTNRQACDDILATAAGWYEILDTIRDLRLMNKEDVRHADAVDIPPIVADMKADMRALAQQLKLTLPE